MGGQSPGHVVIVSASESNLLSFMEMRHHAGAKVAVLVIDEQQNFAVDADRQAKQSWVLRTAAILGCPVWFAEIGPGVASDTHVPLVRAAGFRSSEAAQEEGAVLRKGNKTNVFAGSNLGARLSAAGIEYLVVLGQYGGCCVAHSILGTPKHPPQPQKASMPAVEAPAFVAPTKPLPKPPTGQSGKPLPVPPSTSLAAARPSARPTPRHYDEIRRKPLPPVPTADKPPTAPKLDAVGYCIVLTSQDLVNGALPGSVKNHPKCFVFEAVGTEMWPAPFSEQMAYRVRNAAL